MDIRTITREQMAPALMAKDTCYFDSIAQLQKELIGYYIEIEGLPTPPINLQTKPSQLMMKDFIARITEELGEGYESLKTSSDGSLTFYLLSNFYEELADALHFIMEAIIYAGVTPGNIMATLRIEIAERIGHTEWTYNSTYPGDTLEIIYNMVPTLLLANCSIFPKKEPEIEAPDFSDLQEVPTERYSRYLTSPPFIHHIYPRVAWEITYHLQLARNAMKNKPWKQSQMVMDNKVFIEEISLAFIYLIGLFRLSGVSPRNIFYLYYRKNLVNLFRIRSKY